MNRWDIIGVALFGALALALLTRAYVGSSMNENNTPPLDMPMPQQEKRNIKPEVQEVWPGKLKLANERGYFSGCAVEVFTNFRELERFFGDKPNHLIVEIQPTQAGGILVLWTKTVTDKEIEDFNRVSRKARELLDAEDTEREAQERKATEAQLEAEVAKQKAAEAELAELKRLAALGRKCERKHKGKEE